jgi:hypothetical protein
VRDELTLGAVIDGHALRRADEARRADSRRMDEIAGRMWRE